MVGLSLSQLLHDLPVRRLHNQTCCFDEIPQQVW